MKTKGIIMRKKRGMLKILLGVLVMIFCLVSWGKEANALFEPPEWLETEGKIVHIIFGGSRDFKTYLYADDTKIYIYNYKTAKLAEIELFVASKSWQGEISSEKSPLLSRFPYNATWKKSKDTRLSIWFRIDTSIIGVEFPPKIRLNRGIKICEKLIRDEEKRQKEMFSTPLSTLSTFQSAVKENNLNKARSCLSSNLPPEVEAYWDYMTRMFPMMSIFQTIEKGKKETQPSIGEPIIKGETAQVKVDFSKIPSGERYRSPIVFLLGGGIFTGKKDKDSVTINFIREESLWKIYISTSPLQATIQKSREQAKQAVCMSNLKQIGLALHMYAVDHNEKFPKSLKELYPNYVAKAKIFKCPADKNIKEIKEINKGTVLSYTYVKGLTKTNSPDTVLVYDASVENHGDGRNVLFLDGHVKWYREGEFQKLLHKTK